MNHKTIENIEVISMRLSFTITLKIHIEITDF